MKQEGLKFFTDTYMTSFGLMIFFLFFVGVTVWVYRKNSNIHYARMLEIPLQGDGE